MVFSSITFLFVFLPCVLIVYYTINPRFRNLFLTFASLFFYAWGEQKLVMLMLFSIVINYLGGIVIGRYRQKENKKPAKYAMLIFVAINVALLGYFKYTNFFIDSMNEWGIFRLSSLNEIVLPIGISFFTFQGMSYLIDVYYRRVEAQNNLVSLALYISMFPQLIAGPIVRYIDVAKQIEARRKWSGIQIQDGIRRFITGLFKKVIIANAMGLVADAVFNDVASAGGLTLWVGCICYAFQIYFDFSGYSDMAIGLGKMFGFNYLENFNLPYISKSVQEFWRRWHISLSTWFKDYLYIPLGGNRKSVSRTYMNLIIVFFITGLWHGASWNFIVWGLFHGLFLILERVWLGKILVRIPAFFAHLYLLFVVLTGWVFFRAETLKEAIIYLKGMFGGMEGSNAIISQYITPYFVFVSVLAILLSTPLKRIIASYLLRFQNSWAPRIFMESLYLFLLLICLLELAQSNYNPFIYFRF